MSVRTETRRRETDGLPKLRRPDPVGEPMRNKTFKCDDPTWDNAAEAASRNGLTLAEVLRHYLREYAANA